MKLDNDSFKKRFLPKASQNFFRMKEKVELISFERCNPITSKELRFRQALAISRTLSITKLKHSDVMHVAGATLVLSYNTLLGNNNHCFDTLMCY